MKDKNVIHIDCACISFNHVMRVIFEEDDKSFYIEYRLWNNLSHNLKMIWKALFGKPVYFTVDTVLDDKGAKKLADFINTHLSK